MLDKLSSAGVVRGWREIMWRVLGARRPEGKDRPADGGAAGDVAGNVAGNVAGGVDAGVSLPYSPGLDGLRALSVIAVLLYHAGVAWLPGGFLGVEVFFVISGYLITALLLAEWDRRGRINVAAFWLRRARRLLPALFLLLVVVLTFAVVFLPGEVAGLRGDVLAAFGYVTNWYLILGQESYFEAVGRPSLLKHLWSLAVEEQFYLLWPLLLATGLTFWSRRRVLVATLLGVVLSALLMAVLFRPDVDPSRVYYGTDTRAMGLLVGAALAFLWVPGRGSGSAAGGRPSRRRWVRRLQHRWGWTTPFFIDVAGVAALAGLVVFCLRLGEFQPFLYRGGFIVVDLLTAALILVVAHPRARLGSGLLGREPLRWVGLRSYGIYLWHWPVFMVTRPQLDVPFDGIPLLALRLALTLVLAELSYRFVETPIRRGALGRAWERLRESRGPRRRQLGVKWGTVAATALVFSAGLGVAVAQAQAPEKPSYLSEDRVQNEAPPVQESEEMADAGAATPDTPAPAPEPAGTTAEESTTVTGAADPQITSVTAVGDSVMVGAAGTLQQNVANLAIIDAEVGTQADTAIAILRSRQAAGQLGDAVVVHVGNNGPVSKKQFNQIMRALADVRKVVVVNTKVPRSWEQHNNQVLAEGVQRHPNAVLADWYAASADRPELFWDDGIHLRPEGQQVYTDLISGHLNTP